MHVRTTVSGYAAKLFCTCVHGENGKISDGHSLQSAGNVNDIRLFTNVALVSHSFFHSGIAVCRPQLADSLVEAPVLCAV